MKKGKSHKKTLGSIKVCPFPGRNEIGALWENFLVSERKKLLAYTTFYGNTWFWRNRNQAEIDYIEEENGEFSAYEFKWNPKAKVRLPKAFLEGYKPVRSVIVHRENYWEWL